MRTCAYAACERTSRNGARYCHKHQDWARSRGLAGRTDASPCVRHVQSLLDTGWTIEDIADASGVHGSSVTFLMRGEYPTVWALTARRLLELTPDDFPEGKKGALVPGTGFIRRAEALSCIGWPFAAYCDRIGVSKRFVGNVRHKGTVRYGQLRRMIAVYEELSAVPGPSELARVQSRRRGYAPPLAWDEGTLDDPQGRPHQLAWRPGRGDEAYQGELRRPMPVSVREGGKIRRLRDAERVPDGLKLVGNHDEVVWLREQGLSVDKIAERFGTKPDYIQQILRKQPA